MLSVPIFDDVVFRSAGPIALKAPVGISHSHPRVKRPPGRKSLGNWNSILTTGTGRKCVYGYLIKVVSDQRRCGYIEIKIEQTL
jgi:hypothetical protein